MREILFRGKRMANGEWAYGDLLNVGVDYDYAIRIYSGREHGQVNAVNEKTIGQFTGLTDKNGKKIFEGDIIHAYYANAPKADFVEQVVFCDGRFCSLFSTIGGSGKMWSALPFSAPHIKNDKSIYMEWCEIIGNIHDNPELLKEAKNEAD